MPGKRNKSETVLNNGGIRVLVRRLFDTCLTLSCKSKPECEMSSLNTGQSVSPLVQLDAMEDFCNPYIHTKYFFFFSCSKENLCWVRFHLWQWPLHPSQVEMWWWRRMSWWVRWIGSSVQWVAQRSGISWTCCLIKAWRNWRWFSQIWQDDLSTFASIRTGIIDTKDSGRLNAMSSKLSNVPVLRLLQAALCSVYSCL